MTDSADSVQDDADTGTNADGGAGTGSPDKTSGDQDMVPRAALDSRLAAKDESIRRLEMELAEVRGRVEGMSQQGSNGGGEKRYTERELNQMVNNDEITETEAAAIIAKQEREDLRNEVRETIRNELADNTKKTATEAEIEKYAEALPDVLVEGTETRAKYGQELQWFIQRGEKPDAPETILRAMRAAFGPSERLNFKPEKGRRETVQDTNAAGAGDTKAQGDKDPPWPTYFDKTQKEHFQKQIDRGFYKDRKDCIERVTKTSEHALKRGAARRSTQAVA